MLPLGYTGRFSVKPETTHPPSVIRYKLTPEQSRAIILGLLRGEKASEMRLTPGQRVIVVGAITDALREQGVEA